MKPWLVRRYCFNATFLMSPMYRNHQCVSCLFLVLMLTVVGSHLAAQDKNEKLKPGRLPSDVRKSLQPGILAEYYSPQGQLLDSVAVRLPSILLKAGEPLSPFVSGRDARIRMAGFLKLKLKGTYQFSAVGNGGLEFSLNGQKLISASGNLSDAAPKSIELVKGYNRIEISYQPRKTGVSKLRLYWTNESFVKEPIPPTQLMFSPTENQVSDRGNSQKKDTSWNQHQNRRMGRELVLQHNCLKCHRSNDISQVFNDRDTPNLKTVANRVDPNWLEEWLLKPSKLRNDISMPRVFTKDETQAVADLAAFLVGLAETELIEPIAGDAEQGGDDFENIGCIGCHHFEKPQYEDEYNRVSLFFTGAKFKPGRLAEFLADSRDHYQWSRMPKFRLTGIQTADLEAFIRSESKGSTTGVSARESDPVKGKLVFQSRGCANCHVKVVAENDELHSHAPGFDKLRPGKGCLSLDVIRDPSATPDFELSKEDRTAIDQLLRDESGESFLHVNLATFAARTLRSMRCTNCHDLDDEQATLPYIIEEEGVVGLPPNRIPMLTFAGEKLLPDWSEKLISGKLNYRVREHFRVQMPGFPARGKMIAEGLSHLHGFERNENEPIKLVKAKVESGKQVAAMETGLSCNRCHAIADRKPNAAFDAQSTNLIYAAQRLRKEYYLRWMFDPLRIDKQTKMPRFSEDRKTTSLKKVEDGDARRQFEVLWQYLNSLKDSSGQNRTLR